MTIHVECHTCGRKFQAPKRLTGQQVKCPGCGAPIQVGSAAAAAIEEGPSILVECGCHRQFQVHRESAGGKAPCPECGQQVPVPCCPGLADEPKSANDVDLNGMLEAEMNDPAAPTEPRPKKDEGEVA